MFLSPPTHFLPKIHKNISLGADLKKVFSEVLGAYPFVNKLAVGYPLYSGHCACSRSHRDE